MNNYYRQLIENEFRSCVNGTIQRVRDNEQTYRPFHTALLSEDALFWSAFERSFSTSFGQRVIEEIAKLVALSNGADEACRQKVTTITIDSAYEEAIHTHINNLRAHRCPAHDWNSSLAEVQSAKPVNNPIQIRVISDMWWRKNGVDNYISLKTVKPNIDQTMVAKEDCLHLKIANPSCNVYFGLPYNPFGDDKASYNFNPPMGIFDFHNDSVVLIGKEMWDTIGGSGCYEELIDIANSVGKDTKTEIDRLKAYVLGLTKK